MTDIANLAAAVLRIPIVEKTGLTGLWDHEITFLVEPSHSSTARAGTEPLSVDSSLAPFPTALQEQLGLTLETGRGPVDVLVIDSVRQPKAN